MENGWPLSQIGPAVSTNGARAQHSARRDQSFYPQIPFSSQPQFREPINQGLWEKSGANFLKEFLQNVLQQFRA